MPFLLYHSITGAEGLNFYFSLGIPHVHSTLSTNCEEGAVLGADAAGAGTPALSPARRPSRAGGFSGLGARLPGFKFQPHHLLAMVRGILT